MAAARNKRLLHQAALEAVVRYGPQLDALKQLQDEARSTFGQRITAADSTATAIHGAVDKAAPALASAYDEAGLRQAAIAGTLVNHDLAGLPSSPRVDVLKAAGANEAAGAALRLNDARTQALTDLQNRGVDAEAGRGQAIRTAGDQFASDLGKIGAERLSLVGAKGAFQASTLGDLREADRARNFTAGQNKLDRTLKANIAAGNNAVSLSNAATRAKSKGKGSSKPRLPGGTPLATPTAHGAARDKIELALTQGRPLQAHGVARADLASALVKGVGSYTKKGAKPGDPSTHVPGISAVPQLYASVALDLLYDGHVSHKNAQLLHDRGLSVKKLGYPLPPKGADRKRGQQAKSLGAALGQIFGG